MFKSVGVLDLVFFFQKVLEWNNPQKNRNMPSKISKDFYTCVFLCFFGSQALNTWHTCREPASPGLVVKAAAGLVGLVFEARVDWWIGCLK